LLRARGATIVDADLIAREVVEPGGAAYQAVVDRFGEGILDATGHLDRAALADVVFRDENARDALQGITWPAIQGEMARQVLDAGDGVVIMDIPLLKERREPMLGVIVVDTPEDVAVGRLVGQRGFDEGDARRRIAAQISRDERRRIADVVIDNAGDLESLEAQVEAAWKWINGLA
jgi:dephospho-CoA kinase